MDDTDRLSKAQKRILAKFGWNLFNANILPKKLLDIQIEFIFPKVEGDSVDLILNLKEKLSKSRNFSAVAMSNSNKTQLL